ncbi:MAG: L-seryl-tRNA(Sec) selenium transferase [Luminiphilus sp.]|nr:L-seryl-tRNA(Sec) selenium transferase [Luminiphilus sp.]
MNNNTQQQLRDLPSVSIILDHMRDDVARWGHDAVTGVARAHLEILRAAIQSDESVVLDLSNIQQTIRDSLTDSAQPALKSVFNLTGIVLHSNLGRANLADAAIDAMNRVATGANNLEYDLAKGQRGDRDSHIESLICELTGAEAATVVNNNAAAVLLTLNTLALGKTVPVSRGELVEIGGSFRVPDIMGRSGCRLVEVGTTNRTHLKDYANAIDADTALLMRVHTSNYRIEGFTNTVPETELATLAEENNIPFVVDMGCGNLIDLKALGLPHEATAQQTLDHGADLVLFSGDKLLGGPQAGIIAGRANLIASIKQNPLKRALRLDKVTLAALEATLQLYRNPDELVSALPTLRLLTRAEDDIRQQADRLGPNVSSHLGDSYRVETASVSSQIGSGALPVEVLPSAALSITAANGEDEPLRSLALRLRQLPKPVIGRLHNGSLLLDHRCLEPIHEDTFIEQLSELTR